MDNVPLPEPNLVGISVGVLLHRLRPLLLPRSHRVHRWVGSALIAMGGYVIARSVLTVGWVDLDTPTRLVTTGPYAVTRNPMYVGWALLHLGVGAASRSGWILIVLPPAALKVHREVLGEERALSEEFGDEFERYRAAVPRYLPLTLGADRISGTRR
jgi:protein-S-isoprenylcysteine O-methyltransferase Ste14